MNELSPSKIKFNCDFCEQICNKKRVLYLRNKNNFCSKECYSKFVKRKKTRLQVVVKFKPVSQEEFKQEYKPDTEEWISHEDMNKPLIVPDPFEMFNKGKET